MMLKEGRPDQLLLSVPHMCVIIKEKHGAYITLRSCNSHNGTRIHVCDSAHIYKTSDNVLNDLERGINKRRWINFLMPLSAAIVKLLTEQHHICLPNGHTQIIKRKRGVLWFWWCGGSPLSTVRWSVPWAWHRGLTYSACLGPAEPCRTHAALLWRRR